jgi:hypothetical protein
MIGCSKNITAPSVEADRQARELTCPVVVPVAKEDIMDAEVEGDLGGASPKTGGGLKGKLRFNNLDLETGENGTGGTSVEAKPIHQGGPKGKLRFDMIDREAGDAEETPVQESQTEPLKNKWRQMQSDQQVG